MKYYQPSNGKGTKYGLIVMILFFGSMALAFSGCGLWAVKEAWDYTQPK